MVAMANHRGTTAARESRLQLVAEMLVALKSHAEMAAELGVSRQQIGKDVLACKERWRDNPDEWQVTKAQQLAKIDFAERQYQLAWDRSREDKEVSTSEKTTGGKDGERTKAAKRREGQAGDPRFLDGRLKCIQMRVELLKPKETQQVELSGTVEHSGKIEHSGKLWDRMESYEAEITAALDAERGEEETDKISEADLASAGFTPRLNGTAQAP